MLSSPHLLILSDKLWTASNTKFPHCSMQLLSLNITSNTTQPFLTIYFSRQGRFLGALKSLKSRNVDFTMSQVQCNMTDGLEHSILFTICLKDATLTQSNSRTIWMTIPSLRLKRKKKRKSKLGAIISLSLWTLGTARLSTKKTVLLQ